MRPRRIARRLALVATVMALAVPGMATGAGASVDARAAAQSSNTASGEVLATLTISSEKVSVRKDGTKKFKAATDGQGLREGDTIKTDATGTAEVDYGNDAFTRLDVNTTFTIVVLTDEQGARQVQGSLESGQTWNRTAALTESGSFEQEGAGANATVRGTAFSVTCDAIDHCTFTAVVDDIDLTGLDGVTRQLTPLTQCESTDTPSGEGAGDLTGVLCDETTPIPADQLPEWILKNLFQDLLLGLDDGGILTGTLVIDEEAGTATFVPGPGPSSGGSGSGGGGGGPVVARPQIDDPPIAVDEGAGDLSTSSFESASSIDVYEGDSVDFFVRVVEGFDGDLYVVFTALPDAVGTTYFSPPVDCDELCGGSHTQVYVRDESHPDARYHVDTIFSFVADAFPGCEDISCAGVIRTDDMVFYVEDESGTLASDPAEVDVNVEQFDP